MTVLEEAREISNEIIAWRRPEDTPLTARAPTVAPRDLARWLDAGHDDDGRPVALVDTRNAFEIEVGRFSGAIATGHHALPPSVGWKQA